jgi:hypothetical protein
MVNCSCGTLAFTMLVIALEHTNMGWERTRTIQHSLKPYRMMTVTEIPNVVLQLLTPVAWPWSAVMEPSGTESGVSSKPIYSLHWVQFCDFNLFGYWPRNCVQFLKRVRIIAPHSHAWVKRPQMMFFTFKICSSYFESFISLALNQQF